MRITEMNGSYSFSSDKNVAAYYMQADMSDYNIEEPTVSKLRRLYDADQRIYWKMKAKR